MRIPPLSWPLFPIAAFFLSGPGASPLCFAARPVRQAAWVRPAACQPQALHRLFPEEDGIYLLFLSLSGVEDGDAELGARVTRELTERLPTWRSKELTAALPKDLPASQTKSVIETLRCTVSDHAEAEQIGRATGATAVIWGRASCLLPDSAACSTLPLGWELPQTATAHSADPAAESSRLRLAVTVVHEAPKTALAAATPRTWRFDDIDLPSHDAVHAHALLDEAAGVWSLRDLRIEPGLQFFLRARPYVAEGEAGEAQLDVIVGGLHALLGKPDEGRKSIEHALAQCPSGSSTCRLAGLYRLGMLEARIGNTDKSIAHMTEALGVTEHLKDPRGQRVILHTLAVLQAESGALMPALRLFERALAQSEAAHDLPQQAEDQRSLVYVYSRLGEIGHADAAAAKALALYQRLGSVLGQASVLNQLGLLYSSAGIPEGAEQAYARALALARKSKLLSVESTVLANQAMLYRTRDRSRAIQLTQEALRLAEQARDIAGQATARSSLGTFYLEQGELPRAEAELTAALSLRKQARDRLGEAYTRRSLGQLRQRQGKYDEAYRELEQALRMQTMGGNPQEHTGLVLDIGALLSEQGQHDQALAWYREALAAYEKANHTQAVIGVFMRLAQLHEGRGDLREAIAALERALPKLTSPAARATRREILSGLGQLLAESGRATEAMQRYREAAHTCIDPKEADQSYMLLGYALDVALEHGDKAAAEKITEEFRQREAPMDVQLSADAQLLGRTRSPDAEGKYQYIGLLGQSSPRTETGQVLSQLALAGLSRIRHAAQWKGCPGLLVRAVDDSALPVEVGDIVLRVQGQCISGTASLLRLQRQALKVKELRVELWRNGEVLQVVLPGGKVPFFGSPF